MNNNQKLRFIVSREKIWSNEDNSIETVVDVIEQKMREHKIQYRISSLCSVNGGEYISSGRIELIEALDNIGEQTFAEVLQKHIKL